MHQAPESEAAQTHQLIEPQPKHLRSHPDNIPTSCPFAPPFLRVPSLGIPPWCHCHSQITPTTLPPRERSTQISSPAGILLDIPLTFLVVEWEHHLADLDPVSLSAGLKEGHPVSELMRKWLALLEFSSDQPSPAANIVQRIRHEARCTLPQQSLNYPWLPGLFTCCSLFSRSVVSDSFATPKEMATHSSILAWRIPWREEPGRLQSMGSQRVGHDWATSLDLTWLGLQQARLLYPWAFPGKNTEWVATSFSRGSFWPTRVRNPGIQPPSPACQVDSLLVSHLGSPFPQ